MEYNIGTVVTLKKGHPCGTNEWEIIRTGADFKLKCKGCGRIVMVPRKTFEKSVKKILQKIKKRKHCLKPKDFGKKSQNEKKSLNTGTFFDIIVIRDIY